MTRVVPVTSLPARLVVILAAALFANAALAAAPGLPQDRGEVKDPVCGMAVNRADAKFRSEYQGKTYYFCSESCKRNFDKEPSKYAPPAPSGKPEQPVSDPVCGMTIKPADTKLKTVYKGKTYYFCSEGCKQKFDKDPAAYARK